ncbi:restriction endonuclease subunit S [Shewanella bicestrii]
MESLTLMPKYEVYKESGAEWLGDIPDSWELLSNKHIFTLKKKLVGKRSADYDLLSLTLRGIIKRDMDNPEGKFPAEFNTYQEVNCGDFVFCLFDVEETPRTVGLSSYDGMITGAYTVFQTNAGFDNKFLYYFYLNLDSTKRLKPLYRGLRNTIPKDSFMSFKTFVPPHEQQTLIANYLDKKNAQIDEAIAIKEQQISLLKERKQIIIQQAVTQGLDPNVPLKESGIIGVGLVPEHWDIVFNRRVFRENSRKVKGDELPLSLSQVDGVIPSNDMKERSLSPSHRNNFKLCFPGDLVVNRFKGHLGVFFNSEHEGIVTFHYGVFEPQKGVHTKFFEHLYHTEPYKAIYAGASNGMTVGLQNLSNQNFYMIKTIRPPEKEQVEICKYIEKISNEINIAIGGIELQIEKLKEYKTTLINSAVTGKIKITPEMIEQ